jgi:serine O-acetyltransferase
MKKYRKIYKYIQSDFIRYGENPRLFKILTTVLKGDNHCFSYTFWLRLCSERNFFYRLAIIMTNRLSNKHGLQIPKQTKIGHGLYIGHGIGIVINESAVIGNNCNLSQFTTIGSNDGPAAIIGDNVYIGPSVCIVENVIIGNNATIGAGAVVTKDVPENATVAGVPAKVISYKLPGRYICNRYEIIENSNLSTLIQ